MDEIEGSQSRLFADLERLLQIPAGELRTTMVHATDLLAQSLKADKVDAFLYDPTRDSLVAICSSNQPLSALERKLGLEVLPLANGGRVVGVYRQWQTFVTGRLHEDLEELRGVREGLGIKSKIGVPFEMGGRRRGMIMVASLRPDYFSQQDVKYAEAMVRWIGILAHRAEFAGDARRHAMEQSRRAAADELIAVVAHDMRNYLSPIELRLHTLRTAASGEAPARELLPEVEKISKSVVQLGALVSDLLDAARLDQGLFRLDPASLDMVALVQEGAGVLSRPGCNVDVRVQSIGQIIVNGDGRRLRQCVDNVIANAVEQSPPGGTVIVLVSTETSEDGEYVRVSVIDDGPGVPPDILPHIFERHTTGKAHRGGLGLGLFLAKRIAELHGGDLTVDSSPGSGATFNLLLPCQLYRKEFEEHHRSNTNP